jgi:hypothetical protein
MTNTSTTSPASKIDLTLLKRLVAELETMVETCSVMTTDSKERAQDTIVELAKASGIAANISQEGALLMKDLYAAIAAANQGAYLAGVSSDEKSLLDLLGVLGGKAPPKDHGGRN